MNSDIRPGIGFVLLVFAGLGLYGCSSIDAQPDVKVIEVFKPVPTLPELPPELANPPVAQAPTFVAPDDPKAVAALTPDQTLIFKRWMVTFKAQLAGFRALFAGADKDPEPPP